MIKLDLVGIASISGGSTVQATDGNVAINGDSKVVYYGNVSTQGTRRSAKGSSRKKS